MPPPKPWLQSDRLREREFYKYYDPIRALSENGAPPAATDLADPTNCQKPRSSPDRALTAFCQLGALRIGAQRCMLFFFDTEHAYVLAEATKTLSLLDDDVHEADDSLWLGYTVIPRGMTVCEHTINKPPVDLGDGRGSSRSVYIINDLQEDVNFCNRPYVTNGPKARFYAGVPITTPANVRIGAYCVLDDKPRHSFSSAEVEFLQHMSETVMSHLEMIRSRAELQMGANMLTGLGGLVKSSSAGLTGRERTRKHTSEPAVPLTAAKDALPVADHPAVKEDGRDAAEAECATDASTNTGEVTKNVHTPPVGADSRHLRRGAKPEASEDVQKAFQAAAALLRAAMEVDGAIFLDASINTYGGAIHTNSHRGRSESASSTFGTTSVNRESESYQESDDAPCKILGVSESSEDGPARRLSISEQFLKTLLDRYPRGKIWSFEDSSPSNFGPDASETAELNKHNDKRSPADGIRKESAEAEELQRLFPGARGLCLIGMWDVIRDRWFGGTLVWTYSHSRVLSHHTELVFSIAFNEVLMAEVTRLESRLESKAKSDFISSISHELRSPLQGILCGIDLLSEQSSADLPILSQIETCSTTLLEVINHLLDFAKINNLTGREKSLPEPFQRRNSLNHPEVAAINFPEIPTEPYSYAKVTEEVCDSMFYSHIYNHEPRSAAKVDLILDVSADANMQDSADVGAWKRICINIINNALKYTHEGYVAVSLREGSRRDGHPLIVLSVVDTGRGMSPEFLNNRLFRPFEQEDDLTQGTGLGMSIVSKLVDSLGGHIEVQSLKNCGTTITISVPLDDKIQTPDGTGLRQPFVGLQIGLVRTSLLDLNLGGMGQKLLLATLERSCQRLGAELISSNACDIQMVFEDDLKALDQRELAAPTIILCDSFVSAHRLRKSLEMQSRKQHVECIAQPYGPLRLTGAIQACMEAAKDGQGVDHDLHLSNGNIGHASVSRHSDRAHQQQPSDYMAAAATQDRAVRSPADKLNASDLERTTSASSSDPNGYTSPNASLVLTKEEQLVENHLSFRSKPESDEVSTPPIQAKSRSATRPAAIRLLLVDDNTVNLRMLVTYADKNGYDRMTAVNGREAVEAYENAVQSSANEHAGAALTSHSAIPVVILLDINMPVMDGFEAARRIRAFERSRNLSPATIIAITGLGSAESQQKARASGMDLFLTKPVRPRELTSVLAPIVEASSLQTVGGAG